MHGVRLRADATSARARPRRRMLAGVLLAAAVLLSGCATFPDQGARDWRAKDEGQGELGGPPAMQTPSPSPQRGGGNDRGADATPGGNPPSPTGPCVDPDPRVVATCLGPVGAVAVLPDAESALVGERATGRVLTVRRGAAPRLLTTVPVDPRDDGGLTGLVLSPAYAEDDLVYAYAATPTDRRIVRISPGEPPKPILTGLPRGGPGGGLSVDPQGFLLVALGRSADGNPLSGAVLRIDTLGKPAPGNPTPGSPVLSTGLQNPAGICTDPATGASWVTDRLDRLDVLRSVVPGPLPAPAWTWPERPRVTGCAALKGQVAVALTGSASIFLLRTGPGGAFVGQPQSVLGGVYGRLSATTMARDGLLWAGTVNKAEGAPGPTDDRVIRIPLLETGNGDRS